MCSKNQKVGHLICLIHNNVFWTQRIFRFLRNSLFRTNDLYSKKQNGARSLQGNQRRNRRAGDFRRRERQRRGSPWCNRAGCLRRSVCNFLRYRKETAQSQCWLSEPQRRMERCCQEGTCSINRDGVRLHHTRKRWQMDGCRDQNINARTVCVSEWKLQG